MTVTRQDLEMWLRGLIDGTLTREQVASWASEHVAAQDPQVEDDVAWEVLTALAGADSPTTDRPYLYGQDDFISWLTELQQDQA